MDAIYNGYVEMAYREYIVPSIILKTFEILFLKFLKVLKNVQTNIVFWLTIEKNAEKPLLTLG